MISNINFEEFTFLLEGTHRNYLLKAATKSETSDWAKKIEPFTKSTRGRAETRMTQFRNTLVAPSQTSQAEPSTNSGFFKKFIPTGASGIKERKQTKLTSPTNEKVEVRQKPRLTHQRSNSAKYVSSIVNFTDITNKSKEFPFFNVASKKREKTETKTSSFIGNYRKNSTPDAHDIFRDRSFTTTNESSSPNKTNRFNSTQTSSQTFRQRIDVDTPKNQTKNINSTTNKPKEENINNDNSNQESTAIIPKINIEENKKNENLSTKSESEEEKNIKTSINYNTSTNNVNSNPRPTTTFITRRNYVEVVTVSDSDDEFDDDDDNNNNNLSKSDEIKKDNKETSKLRSNLAAKTTGSKSSDNLHSLKRNKLKSRQTGSPFITSPSRGDEVKSVWGIKPTTVKSGGKTISPFGTLRSLTPKDVISSRDRSNTSICSHRNLSNKNSNAINEESTFSGKLEIWNESLCKWNSAYFIVKRNVMYQYQSEEDEVSKPNQTKPNKELLIFIFFFYKRLMEILLLIKYF